MTRKENEKALRAWLKKQQRDEKAVRKGTRDTPVQRQPLP